MMARRDRTDMKPANAIGVLAAVLIGIFGALLWVHWFSCSQTADAAMCITVSALPMRGPWWRRWLRRAQIRWAEHRMADTEQRLRQWSQMLLEDSVKREDLRQELAQLQRNLLQLRSRP